MPITLLNNGQEAEVIRVTGNDEMKTHLSNLGFVKGKKVKLFFFDGVNYIIMVDNSKYALNKDLAKRIYVREM